MLQIVIDAIHKRATLVFSYKGSWREVEPHTYGLSLKGQDALCAWQTSGGSGADFRLFLMADARNISIGPTFDGSRPGYHAGDQRFRRIYAEL